MCDTILAPPGSTAAHSMLFGKNSDRQRNEAQIVDLLPQADYESGVQVKCTYISVPQVRHTHRVLLCRPFWIWGAEMGANEHGVAIGNEAVFARSLPSEEPALTGMDLLRLALERATSAAEAVEVITVLLARYGQGGNCGHLTPSYYHNSFMIADPKEGFVLETVGREWLVEHVQGVRAISNAYSIDQALRVSAALPSLIRELGWSTEVEPRYAQVISDPHKQHIGSAKARRACSTSLLRSGEGHLGTADMMRILRDHGTGEGFHSEWQPECIVRRSLCLHAGAGDQSGQTVGSMVSELRATDSVHWVTGTAAPCLSVFKPVLLEAPLPAHGPRPTDRFDAQTLWWRHERLHRAAMLGDTAGILADIRPERDALEERFRTAVDAALRDGDPRRRTSVVGQCWQEAIEAEDRWYARLSAAPGAAEAPFTAAWRQMNELAGLLRG